MTFTGDTLVVLALREGGYVTAAVDTDGNLVTTCRLLGRSWLSYDRAHVITVLRGAQSRVIVTHPTLCTTLTDFTVNFNVSEADAHAGAQRVILASHKAGGGVRLALHNWLGEPLTALGEARNAELGFSPDGSHAMNFDHAGSVHTLWASADGKPRAHTLPEGVDVHFSSDGGQLFASKPGLLWAYAWPAMDLKAIPVAPSGADVLRAASQHGGTLLLQMPNPLQPAWPYVRLFDPRAGSVRSIGTGHIDATALSEDGTQYAVAVRAQQSNRVTITLTRGDALFTP
jgi:hypothetical protein